MRLDDLVATRATPILSTREFCDDHGVEEPSVAAADRAFALNLHFSQVARLDSLLEPGVCPFPDRRGRFWMLLLDVSVNRLRSLRGVAGHPLRVLDVSVNHLSSFEGLPEGALPQLEVLTAANNALTTLEGLTKACPKLRLLDVSHNALDSLQSLGPSARLERLDVRANGKLQSLRGLEGLSLLRTLDASACALTSASHVADVGATLRELNVRDNQLADLDDLTHAVIHLVDLRRLAAAGNPCAEQPNYRVQMLENGAIEELDLVRVTQLYRQQLQAIRFHHDVSEVVNSTRQAYVSHIGLQQDELQRVIAFLHSKEADLTRAFDAHRADVEAELEACVAHTRAYAKFDGRPPWALSEAGREEWRAALADETRRVDELRAEAAQRREFEERHAALADSAAVDFNAKLRTLAYERPEVWRRMKAREAALRDAEEQHGSDAHAREQAVAEASASRWERLADEVADQHAPGDKGKGKKKNKGGLWGSIFGKFGSERERERAAARSIQRAVRRRSSVMRDSYRTDVEHALGAKGTRDAMEQQRLERLNEVARETAEREAGDERRREELRAKHALASSGSGGGGSPSGSSGSSGSSGVGSDGGGGEEEEEEEVQQLESPRRPRGWRRLLWWRRRRRPKPGREEKPKPVPVKPVPPDQVVGGPVIPGAPNYQPEKRADPEDPWGNAQPEAYVAAAEAEAEAEAEAKRKRRRWWRRTGKVASS